MIRAALTLLLLGTAPTFAADDFYTLYAAGKYEDAIRTGTAAGSAAGYAIAARAVLADAAMRPGPCLACLKRAEGFAGQAIAADAHQPDGHIWLSAAIGLEGRVRGLIWARLSDAPGRARANLDAALAADPDNAYALVALGAWHMEIVHAGGAFLARQLYGATVVDGLALFDRAVAKMPDNVAVRYQVGLCLAGVDPDLYRDRVVLELNATIHGRPATAYETAMQGRARELLTLLQQNDRAAFAVKMRLYQGYPR